MKEYKVSYWIGKMYHSYIIDAESEDEAKRKVLRGSYYPESIQGLKAERYFPEWN